VVAIGDCYSYELPPDRIAQRPVHPYDRARLMVLRCKEGAVTDKAFVDFPALLSPGDLVIFNNSKVIPARIFGKTELTGAEVEILLLNNTVADRWIVLGRPLKKLTPGTRIVFPQGLTATTLERCGEMEVALEFVSADNRSVRELLFEVGSMPVPPYIRGGRGDEEDRSDYQSIFAAVEGSVAAPTASLHFTPELLANMRAAGAEIAEITLHVGAASFLPLWREGQAVKITPPGSERGIYSGALKERILATKARGTRVITVGTTVVRAVETMMRLSSKAEGEPFDTELFISPGFEFKAVDWLVTNFHQPATTHLLLVEALLGRAMLDKGYQHALTNGYRFLSYGDGMVIIP